MGIVDTKYSKIGSDIVFESRGIKNSGTVTKLPFVKHNYKRNKEFNNGR